MPKLDHDQIELIFIAVTALSIFFQMVILLAILMAVRKSVASIKQEVEDFRTSAMPIIYNSRDMYLRIAPKLEETVQNVSEIARNLNKQATEVGNTATAVMQRVNVQTSRVDAMVTTVLDSVDRAAELVAVTVEKPVRQISGLLASVKAVIESLAAPVPREKHSSNESEPMI